MYSVVRIKFYQWNVDWMGEFQKRLKPRINFGEITVEWPVEARIASITSIIRIWNVENYTILW